MTRVVCVWVESLVYIAYSLKLVVSAGTTLAQKQVTPYPCLPWMGSTTLDTVAKRCLLRLSSVVCCRGAMKVQSREEYSTAHGLLILRT